MKRLYRSRSEEMIAGVCGGLAEYLNVDPTVIRLVFLLLFFAGGGGLFIYLILWVIMPLEPVASAEIVEVQEETVKEAPKKVEAPKTTKAKKSASTKKSEES
jgi:phage shock protein C